ncbi:MAG: protein translocase subunit SecF, partial [Halanaerobiaceae bacterium]
MTESMDILGKRRIWYTISLIVLIVGIGFLIFRGVAYGPERVLNFGLDFRGGSLLEFSFDEEVSSNEVRDILTDIDIAADARVQESEQQGVPVIMIRAHELETEEKTEIEEALTADLPLRERLRDDHVSPVIGQQLRTRALLAMLVASIAIVAYISFRFEFRFAIVAIIALLHDVLVTTGIF